MSLNTDDDYEPTILNRERTASNASDLFDDPHRKLFKEQQRLAVAPKPPQKADSRNELNYFEQLPEYVEFRRHVPSKVAVTLKPNQKTWTYLQFGDRQLEPLIILHDFCGTADSLFQQILSLATRGYHVIAINLTPCFTHDEFVIAFKELIDYHLVVSDKPFHLMGVGLGGFLAQCFLERYSDRVASLILCNSFVDNNFFAEYAILSDFYLLMPNFLLKTKIEGIFAVLGTEGEKLITVSNEYMVDVTHKLPRKQNASRLSLLCSPKKINREAFADQIPDDHITIIDTMDKTIYPNEMREQLHQTYTNARFALLKDGGTFPYLSRVEEFNMYLTVHMRSIAKQNLPVYEPEEDQDRDVVNHDYYSQNDNDEDNGNNISSNYNNNNANDLNNSLSPILIEENDPEDYAIFETDIEQQRQETVQQKKAAKVRSEKLASALAKLSSDLDGDDPIF